MAIAFVQAKNNQAAPNSGVNNTVSITTTAGNLLVLMSYTDKASNLTPTISDSASQTWTQAGSNPTVGNGICTMWYMPNSASVTSVSVAWATYSGGATTSVVVFEFSGAALSTPLDSNASNPVTSSGAATATSLASGSLSTSNANDVLVYAVGENGNQSNSFTVGSGFTLPSGGQVATNGRAAMAYKIVALTQSGATVTMSWSSNVGGDRLGILGAFADTNQGASFVFEDDSPPQFQPPPTEPIISVW
jgi:hypothetical protein